jgi:hypothetical protein
VVGEKSNSEVLVNLPVIDVPRCASSSAKTLGLKQLQLPGLAECSGPPVGARIIHRGTEVLPVEQDRVPDGEATFPIHG